jgi:hypothetical protein
MAKLTGTRRNQAADGTRGEVNPEPKSPPSLDVLVADPAQVANLEDAQVGAVLVQLAALQAALAARLLNHHGPAAPTPDRMLSLEQGAAILQQSPEWIRRHAKRLAFVRRISRNKFLCSEAGLNRWLATRRP